MGWLIAYDIADPRRLRAVHERVRESAFRLQYSLFWADVDHGGARRIARELEPLIRLREDDVRLYHLPSRAPARLLGPLPWPSGVGHAAARRFCGR